MASTNFTLGVAPVLARLLAGMLIASAAAAGGGGAIASGVEGTVTLSPACGGPQREDGSCHAPYVDVEMRLIGDGGGVVASGRTSSTGRYRLAAPPGTYRLQVMAPLKFTRCPSPAVNVLQQQISVVDIDCDSGMR